MRLPDERDPRLHELEDQEFDILIVGAGIYGATLACATARAGFSVAMIDRDDYGAGASAHSMKILHGGLRYLQQFNLPRMRQSILSRRDGLLRLPYLTHPMAFLAPTERSFTRSRLAFEVAARLNDGIGLDRNHHLARGWRIPPTRVLSSAEAEPWAPGLDLQGHPALLWHDGFIHNTERYTLAYVLSAREAGARVVNYVRAQALKTRNGRIEGVEAQDQRSGRTLTIRARLTVNATSAWRHTWNTGENPEDQVWVRSMNVMVRRQWFGPAAAVGRSNGVRNFFFVPWRGGTIIGTANARHTGDPDRKPVTRAELAGLVDRIRQVFPACGLEVRDVCHVHAGVLPGCVVRGGRGELEPDDRTRILWGGPRGNQPGYLVVQGVKYTTAAWWADQVARRIAARAGRSIGRDIRPLYGAEAMPDESDLQAEAARSGWNLPLPVARNLLNHFGARTSATLRLAADHPELRAPVPGLDLPGAAIAFCVAHEDALHLTDIVLRRTEAGTFGRPAPDTLGRIADLMADALGWSAAKREDEIRRVDIHYQNLGLE